MISRNAYYADITFLSVYNHIIQLIGFDVITIVYNWIVCPVGIPPIFLQVHRQTLQYTAVLHHGYLDDLC